METKKTHIPDDWLKTMREDQTVQNTVLSEIQRHLSVPKNQKNDFAGFNYRSADDILQALKPLMSKYDFAVTLSDEIVAVGNNEYVKSTATLRFLHHAISTSAYAKLSDLPKMSPAQATGAASSYARKYALNGLFALDDNKDPDSMNFMEKTVLKQNRATKEQINAIKLLGIDEAKACEYYKVKSFEELTNDMVQDIFKRKGKKYTEAMLC